MWLWITGIILLSSIRTGSVFISSADGMRTMGLFSAFFRYNLLLMAIALPIAIALTVLGDTHDYLSLRAKPNDFADSPPPYTNILLLNNPPELGIWP